MNLKETLFPSESNITGYTDRNNKPILVGQKIRDESTVAWDVIKLGDKYGVSVDSVPYSFIELGLFITLSPVGVEIVVQDSEHNEAPVAMAPFRNIKNEAKKVKTKRSY